MWMPILEIQKKHGHCLSVSHLYYIVLLNLIFFLQYLNFRQIVNFFIFRLSNVLLVIFHYLI